MYKQNNNMIAPEEVTCSCGVGLAGWHKDTRVNAEVQ